MKTYFCYIDKLSVGRREKGSENKMPKLEASAQKSPKFYLANNVRKPLTNKHKPKPAKLRVLYIWFALVFKASITSGTVLILLSWRFKGKRVVFLKQLPSRLLLVTGINGVPLRRVNQSYVIGTSTKVDIAIVNVDKFDDKHFVRKPRKRKQREEASSLRYRRSLEKNVLPQEKKDDQKMVDIALLKAIESVPDLKSYLGARFSLKVGMKPRELVF
ncbi:60S ribosomal protein L6 [Spatholobus suberectus]|nr:60S ribosomal protein L6 [Spatholobus suberectus]